MKKVIGILFLLAIAVTAFAQKRERPLVQFSGIVHNADSSKLIVPYVNIMNASEKGVIYQAAYNGYFSFVAHEQDTLRFSSVGYASEIIIIPSNLPTKSYTLQVSLKPVIINLPVFRIFPWATTEEFTKEFISMKLADDDMEIVRKNLSRTSIQALERTLPRDGGEMNTFSDFHNNVVNSHSITNPLLNPLSWGSLIRQISEGDKSRSTDNSSSN